MPGHPLLTLAPEALVERALACGLRGRGGGHFPTGRKWEAVRREGGDPLVIANGAEGEPGSIKDRFVMTRRADELILGLELAARAVGAREAIVYLKGSFADVERALLDSLARRGSTVPIRVVRGQDGYVAGEETALLEDLEGRRAWPRPKPPYPAGVGLRGRPTLVQNVETLAALPRALADPRAFRADPRLLVSLWGHVARPGVYEVRSGLPVSRLIDEHGGGAPHGVSLVFPAGPSAPPLAAAQLATPLDPESLREAGSGLGTASVLVVDAESDLLAVLASLAAFFEREACGQCPPCTVGTASLHRAVGSLAAADARAKALAEMRDAGAFMGQHGYCAHCRTAAASVQGAAARWQHLAAPAPAGLRSARPFDPGSPERAAIEAVAAAFASAPAAP